MNVNEFDYSSRLGAYTPSIFLIKIDSNDSIEYTLESDNQCIILHEYIHYLQDISTVYGNLNFANYYNRLKYGVNQIYRTADDPVMLPIPLSDNPYIEGVVQSFPYIFGNTFELNGLKGDALLRNTFVKIENVTIPYYYFETTKGNYIIGSKDIKESMAFAIQKSIYGDTVDPPFFPYKTVEYLIGIITPEIQISPIIISGLCELSLNSSNPANMLINSLRRIADNNLKIETIDDLCSIFIDDVTYVDHEGNKIESVESLYNYTFNTAKNYAMEIFNVPEFSKLINWITVSFDNAKKHRKNDPLFISRGLTKQNPVDYFFHEILLELGCPTLINNHYIPETIDHPHNTNQVVYFSVVKELMNILFNGEKTCELYSGCLSECQNIDNVYQPNENCYEGPWRKSKENNLCPLAKLFHMWAISDRTYQISV
jgi:hypothetical protein